ncbi:hypothetical protein DL764_000432 [Monosporascus ibericus]|uniref:Fucose-specific lectin n=1 Tax=Monosporascus ibericus TaxID=155417 RepID=A0A4Q4TYR4_9PEZI|nr:hypothetical protein DL764_000432 [Monosporascus ibericus]
MPQHGSGRDEYEMVTSPKVLLPTSNDGAVVSSGPQFCGSGGAALPEPTWTTSEDTSSQPASVPEQVVMKDPIAWEVPAKKKATDRGRKYGHWYCCWGCCGFCGLSRPWRWVVGVLATLLLVAIIVGAVIGTVARDRWRSRDYWYGSGRTSASDGDPWELSKLAALSWTDGANATRRAVFYQLEGALMVQLYHSGNQTWRPHNISADFSPQNLNVPNVKTATPLAAVATPPPPQRNSDVPFAAALYYMNMDNEIREVVSRDEDLAVWTYGEDHPPRSAADYTQLAAAADFCSTGCRDAFCYAYQDRDQRVLLACGDDWDNVTRLDGAHPGGALALIPVAVTAQSEDDGSDGDGDNPLDHELRLFHYTDTNVNVFRIRNDSSWDIEERPVLSSLEPASAYVSLDYGLLPKVVAAPSGADLADMFAFAIDGGSQSSVASWYNGTAGEWAERDRYVDLNTDISFSADGYLAYTWEAAVIAMDYDGSFYSAMAFDWGIARYVWDPEVDPFLLKPAEEIDISQSCISNGYSCEA